MKMKNEKSKMMMALAVVAALAAVSFAGIAMSDDAAAAEGTMYPLGSTEEPTIINESGNINYQFYFDAGLLGNFMNHGFVYVAPGVSVTGTISVGIRDDKGTASPADDVFTAIDTLKVTNAGSFRLTLVMIDEGNGEYLSLISIGNIDHTDKDLPKGDFEVTKGKVVLGQVSGEAAFYGFDATTAKLVTAFTGTIKAAELTVVSNYAGGMTVGVENGKAIISGGATTFNEVLPGFDATPSKITVEKEDRFVSLSGKADVKVPTTMDWLAFYIAELLSNSAFDPFDYVSSSFSGDPDFLYIDSVTLTVEEGSEINVGNAMPEIAGLIEIAIEGTLRGSGMIIGNDGNVYISSAGSLGVITFEDIPVGPQYMVYLNIDNDGFFFYGTLTINGSATGYTASLGTNQAQMAVATSDVDDFFRVDDTDPTDLGLYVSKDYRVLTSVGYASSGFGVGKVGALKNDERQLTFDDYKMEDGDKIFAVLQYEGAGRNIYIYDGAILDTGTMDSNALDGGDAAVRVSGVPADFDEVRATAKVTTQAAYGYIALKNNALVVKGTINVAWIDEEHYGDIYNLVDTTEGKDRPGIVIEGDGMIAYEVEPPGYTEPLSGMKMVAAQYFEDVGTGADRTTTYYYTTLETAMKNSDDITLHGRHVILKDTTFDTTFTEQRITIASDGELIIGQEDDPATEDENEYAAPTLTIKKKVKIINANVPDAFAVVAGQAVFETTNGDLPLYEPESDVITESETKIVYADLATALKNAVSGDKVVLRGNAVLNSDATVKDGVTLEQDGYDLEIPEKKTLTVVGEYISNGKAMIAGTLIVSGKAIFSQGVELSGTINVTSTGNVTVEDNELEGYAPSGQTMKYGILIVAGTFNAKDDVEINELFLTGTYNTPNATTTILKKVTIGTEPNRLTTAALTNDAVLSGRLNIDSAAYVLVWGTADLEATDFGLTDDDMTKFVYGDLLYATQYADGSVKVEYLFATKLIDFDLKGWYNNPQLIAPALIPFSATEMIGATEVFYGHFTPKEYKLSLENNAGVNWLVNGQAKGQSNEVVVYYGDTVRVNVDVLRGFSGTPVILKDGSAYRGDTNFTITGNSTFTVSGVSSGDDGSGNTGDLTLIEILLIIIVIIIAIISVIVALRLLRS